MATPEVRAVLDALDEPTLLLERDGTVVFGNRAAKNLVERHDTANIRDVVSGAPDGFEQLLDLFWRSGQPMIGTMNLRRADGSVTRCTVRGSRIAGDGRSLIMLRLRLADDRRFRALTEKAVALNAELVKNKRIRLQLQNALAEKETLLRELNHRVKNNLQMLHSILSLMERQSNDEGREALRAARSRVEAMGLVQRMLYGSEDVDHIPARSFVEELVDTVRRAFGRPGINVATRVDDIDVAADTAFVLGLLLNELLTNALKHAFIGREKGRIVVELSATRPDGGLVRLIVEDDGVGTTPAEASSTGLLLIRSLVRRPGARFRMSSEDGTRCVVELENRMESLGAANAMRERHAT